MFVYRDHQSNFEPDGKTTAREENTHVELLIEN